MLLSFFLFFVAVLMILLSNFYVDISFNKNLYIIITLGIFSLHLFKEKSKKSSNNNTKRGAQKDTGNKILLTKLIVNLIEKSKVEITEITIPQIYYSNPLFPKYITEPIIVSLVSVAFAYLSTKSEKLYFAEENNEDENREKLVLHIKIKLVFYEALVLLFKYLRINYKRKKMHRQKA